jgi:tetratricopeptide (TPR) repeat protein
LVAFALSSFATSRSSIAADRVFPDTGVTASGEIKELSPVKVVIEVRGKTQEYPIADVIRIEFDGEPSNLSRAKELAISGQFDDADAEMRKVDRARLNNATLQSEYVYYTAFIEGNRALSGNGDASQASAALLTYEKDNNPSYHLYGTAELVGRLKLQLGLYDEAEKYFGALTRSPSEIAKVRGAYFVGQLKLKQNKFVEAAAEFETVLNMTPQNAEMARFQTLAKIGKARATAETGDPAAALALLNELVAETDSTDGELHAQIQVARGNVMLKQKNQTGALLAFLRVDTLFFNSPEDHAEALYQLSELWTAEGQPQKAASAKSRLLSNYPGSPWNRS